MSAPDLNSKTAKACAAAGLRCLSKDGGRIWKWGMADADGWPGTDNTGWPWSDWCVNPSDALALLQNRKAFPARKTIRSRPPGTPPWPMPGEDDDALRSALSKASRTRSWA